MKAMKLVGVAALALAGALSVYAVAGEHRMGGMPGFMGPPMTERLADELGLDGGQRERVKAILEAAKPDFKAIREETRAMMGQLADADPAAADYQTTTANARNAAADLAARMVTQGSQVRAEVWQVLTPEQRVEARALQAQFRARMDERRTEWLKRREQRATAPDGAG